MRCLIWMSTFLTVSASAWAANENTTIVLHARDGFAACDEPQQSGLDCINIRPTLDIATMQVPWIYVMLHNYQHVSVLQCAFDWPVAWTYVGGSWDCQGHAAFLAPTAPGPITGTVVVVFDCVQGGALITIGRMIFAHPPGPGCLTIIESGYPFATHVVGCDQSVTPVPPANRGRVCAGPGGYDACWPAATAVESATWGAIKGQYR